MPVDYAAIAEQARKKAATPVDYAALAEQARGKSERSRGALATAGDAVVDVGIGVAKGVGNTVFGLGKAVRDYTPIGRISDAILPGAFDQRPQELIPQNTAQRVGYTAEQVGEFFIPTGAVGKVGKVAEVAKSGGLTGIQGGTAKDAGVSAGLSAVVPGASAVKKAGKAIAGKAEPLVRAAIKPTVASLRKISGGGGLDAKANALVRFIIDNKLTTADKARALFQNAEHELQRVLSVKNAPTDAAVRAERYLQALERSAAKQGLGADDVKLIRQAMSDLVAGPMGDDAVNAAGEAIRVTRATVPAKEALESARASSRWKTRKQWGEQKGTTMEAQKAVERAQRDAVKTAVPEAKGLLQTEGKSLQAAEALDRMAQRAANRDAVSLPAHVVAAGEIASGKVPVLAFAANWLRNNQLKAGIWADALGRAIQNGNAPMAADILKKLGVGSASQGMRTAPAN